MPNKYKNTFDEVIDSVDVEFLHWLELPVCLGLLDKGTYNALKSRGGSLAFLEEDREDEDVLVTSFKLVP